jgi:hypothetical protein
VLVNERSPQLSPTQTRVEHARPYAAMRVMRGVTPCVWGSNAQGPVDLLDTAPSDDEDESLGAGSFSAYAKIKDGLPGATAKGKPAARTKCVRLSPTGRCAPFRPFHPPLLPYDRSAASHLFDISCASELLC